LADGHASNGTVQPQAAHIRLFLISSLHVDHRVDLPLYHLCGFEIGRQLRGRGEARPESQQLKVNVLERGHGQHAL
jgi:hypothetical protein